MPISWPSLQSNTTTGLDTIDKVLTVPAQRQWEIQHIRAEVTSSTAVGNRQLELQIRTAADDVIYSITPLVVQAASTVYVFQFSQVQIDSTAVRAVNFVHTPTPELTLGPGFDVRVFDNATISTTVAQDDMVLHMHVLEGLESST